MMRRLFTSLAVCFFLGSEASVVGGELPVLEAKDVLHGKIVKTDYYTGEALYGYIDGGAELYLEYGFVKLGRQEITSAQEKVVLEVYQMRGANEAYGIFSIHRLKCTPIDSEWPNTCQSRYQLQACISDYYVRIINESGSEAAQRTSVEFYNAVRSKCKDQPVVLPSLFHDARVKTELHNVVIVYGILGLQNGYSEWEPLFKDIRRFSITVLPIARENDQLSMAHILFQSAEDAQTFQKIAGFSREFNDRVQHFNGATLSRFARSLNGNEILFVEASRSFPDLDSYVQMIAGVH